MRHNVAGRKLGRKSDHRKAMFRNMVASLIEHGRIKTTLEKAKELRRIADNMVTLGKANTIHARRQAFSFIRNKDAVKKLFGEIAPSFEKRNGGYTRIYHLGHRMGDAAKMALIEYLSEDLLSAKVEGKVIEKKNEKKAKKAVKAKAEKAESKKTKAEKVPAEKKEAKKAAAEKPKKAAAEKTTTSKKKPATKKTTSKEA